MKNEKLILKWLNGDLTPEELEAFKKTEDYKAYAKIASFSKELKPELLDTEQSYQDLEKRLQSVKKEPKVIKPNFGWVRYAAAAVVAVLISTWFFLGSDGIDTKTGFGEIAQTQLPDDSEVILNAGSSLTINEKNWDTGNRKVNLNGEAFFKVTKGKKFTVHTSAGDVQVLGTQFNVKERDSYFEVHCYEGMVSVTRATDSLILEPGERYRFLNGTGEKITGLTDAKPAWLDKESLFDAVPLELVFEEMQRQFDIEIEASAVDTRQLYSGGFSNTDLQLALQSVCIPLNLSYEIKDAVVKISPDAP